MATPGAAMAQPAISIDPTVAPGSWQHELQSFAFKIWQRASSPESDLDQYWLETELWLYANWQ